MYTYIDRIYVYIYIYMYNINMTEQTMTDSEESPSISTRGVCQAGSAGSRHLQEKAAEVTWSTGCPPVKWEKRRKNVGKP